MSTVKTTNIQHPDAASPNIVLAADGGVTIDDLTAPGLVTGKVLQVVNVQTGAVATGSTAIPQDDTIPQITEGDQYMSLAITPSNVSNILIIEVVAQMAVAAERNMTLALFNGSTNAIGAVNEYFVANTAAPMGFNVTQTAGTTSAITFTVRAGNSAGTTSTLNGIAGTRFFGGVSASSITITEYTP